MSLILNLMYINMIFRYINLLHCNLSNDFEMVRYNEELKTLTELHAVSLSSIFNESREC